MLRPLTDLPAGVIGFEAVGEVHSDDYRDVLRPAVDAAMATGSVRLVYVLGPEFTGYSAGASWQDAKLGVHHLSAWERLAVVTDHEWVDHLVGAFSWMIPAEIRHFSLAERDDAVRWAAGELTGTEPEPEAVPDAALATEPAAVEPAPVAPVVAQPEPERVAEATTAEVPTAPVAPAAAFGGQETVTPRGPMAPGADMRPGMAQPTPPQPQAPSVPAQWAPDPSGRHHHRWWDGNQWTGHVADNGVSSFDPI